MKHLSCNHVFKSGKNALKICNKDGFYSDFGNLCYTHYKQHLKKKEKNTCKLNETTIEWTDDMEKYKKKYTVKELKQQLEEHKFYKTGTKKILIEKIFINKINK
tara:strand:+ start:35 stop:346 length:312 start_codon:yes stop_codon:yes gene_type:complete